jgi:hypothetical protein
MAQQARLLLSLPSLPSLLLLLLLSYWPDACLAC